MTQLIQIVEIFVEVALEEYCCLKIMAESAGEQEKLDAHEDKIKPEDIYLVIHVAYIYFHKFI